MTLCSLLVVAIFCSNQCIGATPNAVDSLWNSGLSALSNNNPVEAVNCGRQLAAFSGDKAVVCSNIILGQSNLITNNNAEAYNFLRKAERMLDRVDNDTLRASTYNGLGIYTMNANGDVNEALGYFFKARDLAKKAKLDNLESLLLGNIASVFFLKRDTSGLEYALECYDAGIKRDNKVLTFIGASMASSLFVINGNSTEALKYAREALTLAQNEPSLNYQTDALILLGEALNADNDPSAALDAAHKALAQSSDGPELTMRALRVQGEALRQLSRYSEARNTLEKALAISVDNQMPLFRRDILLDLSNLCKGMGRTEEALEYMRQYAETSDSLSNDQNLRALQEARVMYDVERKENELNINKMENMRKQRTVYILVAIILLVAIVAVMLFLGLRHKNRLYKAIVHQNRQHLAQQEALHARIHELETSSSTPQPSVKTADLKYGSSSLSDSRRSEIISRLERIMDEDKAFTDPDLTKEKLASLLQTNRSYLSQAINDHYGISYTQYINNLRISEAVKILSKPGNDIPLKQLSAELGFSSISTFYAQFKEETGMTPSAYRKSSV